MTQMYKTQTSSISFLITFAAFPKKEGKNVDFSFFFCLTEMKHGAATFSLNERIKQHRAH